MTTTDAHGLRCATCASALRPADRFCTTCGTPAPVPRAATPTQGWPPRSAPLGAVPTQGWPPPPAPSPGWPLPPPPPMGPPMGSPSGPPPSRPSGRARGAVIAAIAVLAVLAAVGAVLVVRGSLWEEPTPDVAAPSSSTPSSSVPLPAEPGAALRAQREADGGAAETLVGSWAPQLSAKKVGLVVDGQTYDAAAVLADHLRLRGQFPEALLVWSGDWTSFRGADFWITIVHRPSATPEAANAWCESAGLGPDDCYAKRLSHTGDAASHTALRPAGSSGSGLRDSAVPGGAATGVEPTLGDNSWSPGPTGFGDVRPSVINANGDGTSVMSDVTWDSWGGPEARGRGTANWVPPGGYQYQAVPRPAVVIASDLGFCNGHQGYRRVGWYFPTEGETAPEDGGYRSICG